MDACSCHESVLQGVKSPKKSSHCVRKRRIQRTRHAGFLCSLRGKPSITSPVKRCGRGLGCTQAVCVLQSLKFDRYRWSQPRALLLNSAPESGAYRPRASEVVRRSLKERRGCAVYERHRGCVFRQYIFLFTKWLTKNFAPGLGGVSDDFTSHLEVTPSPEEVLVR